MRLSLRMTVQRQGPLVSVLLVALEKTLCLVADKAEQVAHRQIHVDEVEAPIGIDLPGRVEQVARDVVDPVAARSGRPPHRQEDWSQFSIMSARLWKAMS